MAYTGVLEALPCNGVTGSNPVWRTKNNEIMAQLVDASLSKGDSCNGNLGSNPNYLTKFIKNVFSCNVDNNLLNHPFWQLF